MSAALLPFDANSISPQTPEDTEILRLLQSMGTTGNMLFQDNMPAQSKVLFKRGVHYNHHHNHHHHHAPHHRFKRSGSAISIGDAGDAFSVGAAAGVIGTMTERSR